MKKPVKRIIVIVLCILVVLFAATYYKNHHMTCPDGSSSRGTCPSSPSTSGTVSDTHDLGLPDSATVLAVPGLDFHLVNNMPTQFQSYFSSSPYKMNVIDYPRDATKASIPTGITNLDKALSETPGKKIVLGYSEGAQVASGWMLQHANDASAPKPDELTFVLMANPLRNPTGSGIGNKTLDGSLGVATSTDTPWHIVDIARRYDGWADSPTDKSNQDAVKNAENGKRLFHKHYDGVDINDPSLTMWTRGNTTFVLTQENSLPIYDGQSVSSDKVNAMRAHIESAYKRN